MHWLVHSMSDMLNSTNTDITTKGGRGRRTKPSRVSRNTATKAKHDSNTDYKWNQAIERGKIKLRCTLIFIMKTQRDAVTW